MYKRQSLNTIYHEMQRRDNYVTAEKVKNEFLGHSESHETILSLFQKHNDDVKQLVGISKTIATYRKYEVTRRHLAEFKMCIRDSPYGPTGNNSSNTNLTGTSPDECMRR